METVVATRIQLSGVLGRQGVLVVTWSPPTREWHQGIKVSGHAVKAW